MLNTQVKTRRRAFLAAALALVLAATLVFALSGVGSARAAGEPLRYGSRGESVRQVQSRLNELGYWCGSADGIFGSNTLSGVRRFQGAKGLSVDGIVPPLGKWSPGRLPRGERGTGAAGMESRGKGSYEDGKPSLGVSTLCI